MLLCPWKNKGKCIVESSLHWPFTCWKKGSRTLALPSLPFCQGQWSHRSVNSSDWVILLGVVSYMVLKMSCSLELSRGFPSWVLLFRLPALSPMYANRTPAGLGCIFLFQCCLMKGMLVQVFASLFLLLPMSSSTATVFVQGTAVPQWLMMLCSSCLKERLSSLLPLCMLVFVFLFAKYLLVNPVCISLMSNVGIWLASLQQFFLVFNKKQIVG